MREQPPDPPFESVDTPARAIHDGLFKKVFSDPAVAAGELQSILPPAAVAMIDWAHLAPAPSNYIDTVLRQRYGDLVFHTRFHNAGELLLWFLLEHQSTQDWRMPLRVVKTKTTMWDHWSAPNGVLLPPIVPVVVYHGQKPWTAPTAMEELIGIPEPARAALGDHVLRCRFILDDLSVVSDETLRQRKMSALGKLALFALAHSAAENFLQRLAADWRTELNNVLEKSGMQWESVMFYICQMRPQPTEDTMQRLLAIQAEVHKDMAEMMGGTVHRLLLKGYKDGRDDGRQEERREMLMLMLEQRFGPVPPAFADRVAKAGGEELKRWTLRILNARSMDEVFAA